jgi:hypothetical protein
VNLNAVGDQVQDDLLPHVAVDVRDFLRGVAIHHQPQPGALGSGPEDARQFCGECRHIGCLVDGFHASRFDAGEIEQSIDQA